jgi:hypothetical protein
VPWWSRGGAFTGKQVFLSGVEQKISNRNSLLFSFSYQVNNEIFDLTIGRFKTSSECDSTLPD